jgi:aryl-alcohol dehydrogenase-like predicted oxidoreductase
MKAENTHFTFLGSKTTVHRMGYGAMQLAGPHVFGPPKDTDMAIKVLKRAVELGVNHIDTSDFYGPHVTNQIIKKALHPYPKDLVIVTKVGAKRGADGSWNLAIGKDELISAVHDNLKNLGIEALDVVNLRVGPPNMREDASIAEPFSVLVELKRQGKIKHLGLSTITPNQLAECQKLSPVVCVQNHYNIIHRKDDAFIDDLERQGIAYVPYFPLGGFNPLQSSALNSVAKRLGRAPMQVALAWLYQKRSNMLLIPGTSSINHLEENDQAKDLKIPADLLQELDNIATLL